MGSLLGCCCCCIHIAVNVVTISLVNSLWGRIKFHVACGCFITYVVRICTYAEMLSCAACAVKEMIRCVEVVVD